MKRGKCMPFIDDSTWRCEGLVAWSKLLYCLLTAQTRKCLLIFSVESSWLWLLACGGGYFPVPLMCSLLQTCFHASRGKVLVGMWKYNPPLPSLRKLCWKKTTKLSFNLAFFRNIALLRLLKTFLEIRNNNLTVLHFQLCRTRKDIKNIQKLLCAEGWTAQYNIFFLLYWLVGVGLAGGL